MKRICPFFIVIVLVSPVVAQPANDLPCSAQVLPLGLYVSGTNVNAGSAGEPAVPACFDAAPYHTVWYRFTAPPSGCISILTASGTLVDTQIGLYKGNACSSLAVMPNSGCNDNITGCTSYNYLYSFLQKDNLTAGQEYYIMVDGRGSSTGTFTIYAYDACPGANLPPVPGQDCAAPFQVCNQTITVPDPGYPGYGNICDFPGSTNCLLQGEKGSVFYRINCNGTGNLEFSIVPNDYPPGSCNIATHTDYDFAIWKMAGAGATSSCGALGLPTRCNYAAQGVTGCYGAGTAPAGYTPCFDASYEAAIPVAAGDVYLLCVSNWDVTSSGYTLSFSPASPLDNTVPPGGTIVWTGNVSSDWFNIANWGGCQVPDCRHHAVLPALAFNQPVIASPGASVRNITINPGASLTLGAGMQLMVCNDFSNNGTFTAQAGSTVYFSDTVTTPPLTTAHHQYINGRVTSPNHFVNVTVAKPPNYNVITNQDVDMMGNFLVQGGTFGSRFVATGKTHRVAGDFIVQGTTTPYTAAYTTGKALEFIGTVQSYMNQGTLNDVVMNQTAGGQLTLLYHGASNAWMEIGNGGRLVLNSGKIKTGSNRIDVFNRAFDAIGAGNAGSYVENNPGLLNSGIRKYLDNSGASTGTYEFPVGTATRGYERLSLEVTSPLPSGVNSLTVNFNETMPATNPALGTECSSTYHIGGAVPLDNGFWQLQPGPPASFTGGTVTPTLWNRTYSNALAGYTAMFNRQGINLAINWQLNPGIGIPPCIANPVTAVERQNMDVNAVFGNAASVFLATAQSVTQLPVELISFDAQPAADGVELTWKTASERNCAGFAVERKSAAQDDFEKRGWVNGHGTTSSIQDYAYRDAGTAQQAVYYYRLKQMDFDGNYTYTDVLPVQTGGRTALSVDPNAFNTRALISYFLSERAEVIIEFFNRVGQREVLIRQGIQDKGMYHLPFDATAHGLAAGVYSVVLSAGGRASQVRVLLLE